MSELVTVLRAIIRDELTRVRLPELATVTLAHPTEAADSDGNHQVNVRLRASGVELQRVPVAVHRLGFSGLPNEGDLVLVHFLGGVLNAPVVTGCLYDDQAHPPVGKLHEVVYQPPDEEDAEARRFHVELPSGCTVTLQDEKLTVTMGETTVTVNKDGDVAIAAKGKVTVESQSDVELKAQGSIKLEAQGDVSVKGASATLEGQSEAKVKGPSVSLAGNTQFSPS
ncbi:phage baseplate assembly protein V [Hyalangium sp.]|uniref:phage baseplate assembly protein V n=1 Tax=Hyalangium sp. TaxID=2028555 RepID=UPI002D493F6D|nr:phage baseplate assembly protein V [Hyalangium sp.]HYH96893.1 phage baseplate assembly protein V [Hyalangium sp.]